nr:efflux RND transporter periplasmic adaptor subunit [Denitromonas ohlonensis]
MKPLFVLALVVAAAAGGAFLARPGPMPPVPEAHAAADGDTPAAGERKILYYRNPMGLPDTSPEPKKDSMGMDYIPVYADDAPDDSGAVAVSPARLQTLGVKTARAQMQTLDAALRAVGRVEINERAIHDVSPRFEGWIERLYVNASGDPVKRGQALFSVYSPELVSARKEVEIAEKLVKGPGASDPVARDSAQRLLGAARERLRHWQVAAGGGSASNITFNSPANGVVLEKKAVEGMRFAPGMAIYRIADLSSVWVIADVYEQDLARVRVGQPATVRVEAFPDRIFDAKVTYLYPTLNVATRTTPVRLELDNRDGLLRPGMFSHVELADGGAKPRLTVPRSALIDTGERQVVLRVAGEGRFTPQPVRVGQRGRDHIEILEGIADGDEVVVAANFLIDAESNLKAALSAFAAPEQAKPAAKTYEAVGSIDALDAASNSVSMNHDPIPALQWPAMTMDFGLDSADVAKGLLPGEPLRFTFEDRGDGEFVIIKMEKADPAAAAHKGH